MACISEGLLCCLLNSALPANDRFAFLIEEATAYASVPPQLTVLPGGRHIIQSLRDRYGCSLDSLENISPTLYICGIPVGSWIIQRPHKATCCQLTSHRHSPPLQATNFLNTATQNEHF
ncbi:hypothetical protein BDW75DRAFT_103837 [Aspergillus navahoensis]